MRFLVTGDVTLVDLGVLLVVGILVGSFIAAKLSGEFRFRIPDPVTAVQSALGGAGMGIGASLAGGCTIGNAMVQTATFSLRGRVALAFMVLGVGAVTYRAILGPQRRRLAPASAEPQSVTA